ncbi:hypothetical protein AVEN_137087-1 [Araneus ventricosus]|uniref:Uncharacterized protein n=1 Tax=Araneus ventricosus TaxID=182803 RepID=A0A4Y2MT34_ARAVE|nr:hypothetical protein AVEN_137087-1 [Araneus ventricosus]
MAISQTRRLPSLQEQHFLSLSPPPSHPKHLSFILERGVRIRTGSPNPNVYGKSESGTRNGFVPFRGFVLFGRTRVLSCLLMIRILEFVPE